MTLREERRWAIELRSADNESGRWWDPTTMRATVTIAGPWAGLPFAEAWAVARSLADRYDEARRTSALRASLGELITAETRASTCRALFGLRDLHSCALVPLRRGRVDADAPAVVVWRTAAGRVVRLARTEAA